MTTHDTSLGENKDDDDDLEETCFFEGERVGRYLIIDKLGQGGMGVVYRAYDTKLEREVALKCLDARSISSEAQGRLLREARAMAQLSHPNVVTVYDVEEVRDQLIISMEYVKGEDLKAWTHSEPRPWREVRDLFLEAGAGLLAAHQVGMLHRDFKPQNVLIGRDGRARVTDFGLARFALKPNEPADEATDEDESLRSLSDSARSKLSEPLTRFGAVVGTPAFMAPEQHDAREELDARADQYAFCLSMWQCLTGRNPFTEKNQKLLHIVAAKHRGPPEWPRTVDIPDHIGEALRRGLAVKPEDRWPTMQELLAALRYDKAAARRKQFRTLAASAAGLAVAISIATAIFLADRATAKLCRQGEERAFAVWGEPTKRRVRQTFLASGRPYAEDTFQRVTRHLEGWTRQWVEAYTEACEATHVRGEQSEKILDLRMGCLGRKLRSLQALVGVFAGTPDSQVVDRAMEASFGLGGIAFCADVEALTQEEKPPERLADRRTLAELRGRLEEVEQLDKLGKYAEAEARLKELAPQVEALAFPPLQAELAYQTALTLRFLGKYAEAEPVLGDALQLALQWGMKELAARAGSEEVYLVGYLLQRHAEGLAHSLHALALARGRGDDVEARSLNNLACLYIIQGKYKEAEELLKRALAIREEALGPDHPFVAMSLGNLAVVYGVQGKYAKEEVFLKRAIAIFEKALGFDHPDVAGSLHNLGEVYSVQGKYKEAEEQLKRALAIREKALGHGHPDVAASLVSLGTVYYVQGKYGEAEEFYMRALAIWEKALGADHPDVSVSLVGLASTYEKQERFAKALPLLERAREIRKKGQVAPMDRAEAAFALARVLWALGNDRVRARSFAKEALELYQSAAPGAEKQRREVEQWIKEHR